MLGDFRKALPANLKMGLRNAGVILEGDMKRKVSGPGRKRARKGKKVASFSRLNQYPGVISGRLRASIKAVLIRFSKGLKVGANVKYDKFLVRGTKNMPAYDYVGPTWKDKGKEATAAINEQILKPLK